MNTKNKSIIFILSSPSGGGKSSISRKLIAEDARLALSISTTTRSPREGEQDGVHYFFKNLEEFKSMIEKNAFIEYAEIYHNLYGTTKDSISTLMNQGFDILFDIDHQGTDQLKAKLPNQCVSIFIMPPSIETLKDRIENRQQNSHEDIALRMKFAKEEILNAPNYDYQITNLDFNQSVAQVQTIIQKERELRTKV